MEKLISELTRLYLPEDAVTAQAFARHLDGHEPLALVSPDGMARAAAIVFRPMPDQPEGHHWRRLCEVANDLQAQAGLPAPAVSLLGDGGYGLWLSLEAPTPMARVQALLAALHHAFCPDIAPWADAAGAPPALPPRLNTATSLWSAFIHPGMGASFADGSGLDIAPPLAGQAAFLENLSCIGPAQLAGVLERLAPPAASTAPATAAPPAQPACREGLLLKDATLEDIVAFLHAKNIEPTFRFLK